MSKVDQIPKLRFPEFELNWQYTDVKDLFTIINGYAFSSTDSQNYGTKWVKIASVGIGEMVKEDVSYLPESYLDKFKKFILKKGDYVVALTRPILNGRLKISKIDNFYNNSLLNQRVGKIETLNQPDFIYNLLRTNKLINTIENNINGSEPPNLSPSTLNGIKVSTPDIPEQKKIASFLTSVDYKLNQLTKKKKLLNDYKKGVMQKIFSQELHFKDDNGNSYPDWEEKKLGDIGRFKTSSVDKLIKKDEQMVSLVNYMNVYKHQNITNESTKGLMQVSAKQKQIETNDLKKGDILFTPSSETPSDIGHSIVIFDDLDNTLYSYHLIRFRPKIKLDILYSHYFCNISSVLKQISRFATGSTRFTISVDSFSKIIIGLPCLKEQKKIANFLSSIDKKIDLVNIQIDNTKAFKKGLLQQMFV